MYKIRRGGHVSAKTTRPQEVSAVLLLLHVYRLEEACDLIPRHLNGDPCRGREARPAYLSKKTPILTKLQGNALGEGAVVVFPLVLDEEKPTESVPASWLDLKVRDRSREIESEIRLLLS
ncbi:hypothetical protein AAHA92_01166 [Salvia divinorum]|uniref:Uncharacterized protein n=1 Tax=Salvia divinorum TaxID=28513 RepID=A0ABD1IPF2_SALDI